jgi:hypothetical protein
MGHGPFEPAKHVEQRTIDGRELDYLDVRWRIIWLRREHPEAQITTQHVQLTPEAAVFRVEITIPDGGGASAYGSAAAGDGPRFIELAETRALGRALLALGYGTEHAPDFAISEGEPASKKTPELPPGVTVGPNASRDLPPRVAAALARATPIVDEPELSAPPVEQAAPAATQPAEPPAPPVETPVSEQPAAPEPPAADRAPRAGQRGGRLAAVPDHGTSRPTATRAEPVAGRPPPSSEREPARLRPAVVAERGARPGGGYRPHAPADDEAEVDSDEDLRADMDWTAFWRWARKKGYDNRDAIERAIGQPIRGRTPKELRTLLLNLESEAQLDD